MEFVSPITTLHYRKMRLMSLILKQLQFTAKNIGSGDFFLSFTPRNKQNDDSDIIAALLLDI
jgi:hypothetical protein